MKSQKGITLLSVIVYVVALVIVAGTITTITAFFYANTENISDTATSLGEFNKFNLEMVNETKKAGNEISYIQEDGKRIVFTSGSSFTFQDGGIYKDRVKICTGITNCQFKKVMQEEKEILAVLFEMEDFAKTIEYVLNNTKVVNTNIEENYMQVSPEKYVQDGLQLHYDAINNTGDGHSNTTTTWRDLSPNHNDGVLHNVDFTATSGWGEDYIALDGVNDYINGSTAGCDNFTVEFVVKSVDVTNSSQYGSLFMINQWNHNVSDCSLQIYAEKIGSALQYQARWFRPNSDYYNEGQRGFAIEVKDDTSTTFTITKSDSRLIVYQNGEIIDQHGGAYQSITFTAINIEIGRWYGYTTWPVKEKVNSMRVYNRVLSEEEIMHNFLIDKEKYGIVDQ